MRVGTTPTLEKKLQEWRGQWKSFIWVPIAPGVAPRIVVFVLLKSRDAIPRMDFRTFWIPRAAPRIPRNFPSAVPKRGRLNAVGRRSTRMSANECKGAQMQVRKRVQKSAKGRKRAKICKQPGLKEPGLGTPNSQSSETGLFTPRAFFLRLGWSPGFWIVPAKRGEIQLQTFGPSSIC